MLVPSRLLLTPILVGVTPTRLNVPDDPTRGLSLRSPVRSSLGKKLVDEEISAVAKFRFRRFAANWLRLFILLTLPGFSYGFSDPLPCIQISDHFHGFYAGLIPFCCLSLAFLVWLGLVLVGVLKEGRDSPIERRGLGFSG